MFKITYSSHRAALTAARWVANNWNIALYSHTSGHEEENIREEYIGAQVKADSTADMKCNELYPHHIQTTCIQQAILVFGSGAVALLAPWRGDMVATFGETTGQFALKNIKSKMESDAVGRQILQEQPRINTKTLDLNYLESLPKNTFGHEYAVNFLKKYNLNPDDRPPVEFINSRELWYVMTRYREVHDLLHTLLGMPINMLGEVAVKWVEGLQTGLPMCVLGSLFAPVRFGPKFSKLYRTSVLPWALRTGHSANFYMNVYFEKEFEKPIEQLRRELNITPPPQM